MNAELVLPSSSNTDQWDEEQRALMASAGLIHRDNNGAETVAPRSVVASFLYQCERSKLDPHARQIYLIARKNKGQLVWTTQTSIDGFRVIAERSGHYAGQGDVEWLTPEGKWVDVWLSKYGDHPEAARATVYRDDFAVPLRAIAHWDSYVQTNYNGETTAMWRQHGPGQIAKCAEALALRKAFPQDLSALYTADEMQQAENGTDGVPSVTNVRPPARPEPSFDPSPWEDALVEASNLGALRKLWLRAEAMMALDRQLSNGKTLRAVMLATKAHMEQDARDTAQPAPAPEAPQEAAQPVLVPAIDYDDPTPF